MKLIKYRNWGALGVLMLHKHLGQKEPSNEFCLIGKINWSIRIENILFHIGMIWNSICGWELAVDHNFEVKK